MNSSDSDSSNAKEPITGDEAPGLLSRITVWPRRDWRFWGALCAFGGIVVVAAAFWAQINTNSNLSDDNAQLKQQGRTQSAQQECRSRAAVFTEDADIQADGLLARSLIAAVSDVDLEPFRVALSVANENRDIAIRARADAIQTCNIDTAYNIDRDILSPVPPVPQTPQESQP